MDGRGQQGSIDVDGDAVKVNWNPDNEKFYVNRYNLQNANPNLRSREVSRKKELQTPFCVMNFSHPLVILEISTSCSDRRR